MPPLHRVGDTVPAFLFSAGLVDAVRRVRTGHCTYVDCFEVEVDFTVYDNRTDVRIVGLGKDDPGCELLVVGDTRYSQAHRYDELPDGEVRVHTQWITFDLTSTAPREKFIVALGRGMTGIGTPLGLIQGILDEPDATVVASDEQTSTFECWIRTSSVQRAIGENVTGDGYKTEDPGWQSRIVVNADGLPHRIEPLEMDYPFEFSGWGTTPVVVPPDASTMVWLDWEISGP